MDILTLSLSTKKALETLGVKNNVKTISNKGLTGYVDLGTGVMFAKASNEPLDLNEFSKVTAHLGDHNGSLTEDYTDIVAIQYIEGLQFMMRTDVEGPLAFTADADAVDEDGNVIVEKGTYIVTDESGQQVIEITVGTIHPIDPKFLPGASSGGGIPIMPGVITIGNTSDALNETVVEIPQELANALFSNPCIFIVNIKAFDAAENEMISSALFTPLKTPNFEGWTAVFTFVASARVYSLTLAIIGDQVMGMVGVSQG